MNTFFQRLLASSRLPARYQKGQILILVALAIVGIIAVMGLSLDVGMMFVQYARLRRAVDAAALAAALQDRIGATHDDLRRSADEFLTLNGIDVSSATVDDCSTLLSLCTHPPSKLVQVTGTASVRLNFLSVFVAPPGWIVTMKAVAQSEAASVDVVLAIDTSESMTYDALPKATSTTAGNPARDPSYCNNPVNNTPCQPFNGLQTAAKNFVDKLFFPYDRVALINFDKQSHVDLQWSSDTPTIDGAINALAVYDPGTVCPATPGGDGPCRNYFAGHPNDPAWFQGFDCPDYWGTGTYGMPLHDPENCTTTDTGAGLTDAGDQFGFQTRPDALWVVILLTDGGANAAGGGTPTNFGHGCPASTWTQQPLCRSSVPAVRHCSDPLNQTRCTTAAPVSDGTYGGDPKRLGDGVWPGGGVWDPTAASWDAMDYARDAADFVYIDQHAIIYAIGLGSEVTDDGASTPPNAGELFLKYAARDGEPNGGQYWFAPNVTDLDSIFQNIADNIATRLNK